MCNKHTSRYDISRVVGLIYTLQPWCIYYTHTHTHTRTQFILYTSTCTYMYTGFHALTLYSAVKPSCLIMDLKASKRPLYLTRSRDSPPSWTRGMDRIHAYTYMYMHVPNYLTNHNSYYTCTCIIIIITDNLVL